MLKTGQKTNEKTGKKRKGIHAKSKTSHLKQSKNYKKPYRRQGK